MLDEFARGGREWLLLASLVGVMGVVAIWVVRSGPVRRAWQWFLLVSIVSVASFFASWMLNGLSDAYKAYGEVPIPGSARLHLPAGDVDVSVHSTDLPTVRSETYEPPMPEDLEMVITAPGGVPQPTVTDLTCDDVFTGANESHCQVKVAHIPVAGEYTVTTNGKDSASVSPRLAFGHASLFRFLRWPVFPGFIAVSVVACLMTFPWRRGESDSGGPALSDGDVLLASGQRVRGVLNSFTKAETTARRRDRAPGEPELLDAPYYALQVELWMPTLVRVAGRNRQQVPLSEVPKLAVGRELSCVVDPAAPSTRFIVDWNHRLH